MVTTTKVVLVGPNAGGVHRQFGVERLSFLDDRAWVTEGTRCRLHWMGGVVPNLALRTIGDGVSKLTQRGPSCVDSLLRTLLSFQGVSGVVEVGRLDGS